MSRRNNAYFLTNKFCSVVLAAAMAGYTASMVPMLKDYAKENEDASNINTYNFVYWLLFIYYSFTALDELIELYAVYFEREKGALGLLLEMNNFLGIGVVIYLTVFNYTDSAQVPEKFSKLKSFINFQVIFMYVCVGLSMLMVGCMAHMNGKVKRANANKNQQKQD